MNETAAATPIERDEELRLALVLNGGVSLAVWMGGAAFEFNRLVGETHPVYKGLLELTRTRARIDVVSGTSAGGINGAALALATVHDTSLWPLRDVWLERGSFETLLRSASESDPPSLLDGDGVFLPALEAGFRQLVNDRRLPREAAPMDLMLTATMLRGEPQARLDDLGVRIEDANHRAQFRFARTNKRDAFDDAGLAAKLAQAARTSASFPVAFEPRFAAANTCESVVGSRARPLAKARYLIDGGVLDNKPIEGALRAIFAYPARANVRRVLAYVTPDPAASARADDDDPKEPPTLAEVALGSLVTITGAESISDHLDRVASHNAAVRHRRDMIAALVSTSPPAELEQLANMLFDTYRERRIDGLLDYVVEEIEHGLAQQPADGGAPVAFGRRTREWLKSAWRTDPDAGRFWEARVPCEADRWSFSFKPPGGWTWGLYALDFGQRLVFEMLRRTQRLRHLAAPKRLPVVTPPDPAGPAWEELDAQLRAQRAAPPPVGDAVLSELWSRAFRLQRLLDADREQSSERFAAHAAPLMRRLAEAGADDARRIRVARDWLNQRLVQNPDEGLPAAQRRARRKRRYAWFAGRIATLLIDVRPSMLELLRDARPLRPDEEAARNELRQLHDLLYLGQQAPDAPPPKTIDPAALMRRVLQLEVVSYALAGRAAEQGAYVELVQVSASCTSPWGGGASPREKLAGMQLAHFGAFYRKAWRANDWMIGRLDGIDRLVRIALNPDRLHRLCGGSASTRDAVIDVLRRLAVDSAAENERPLLRQAWDENLERLRAELAFLERTDALVPETLPVACAALIRRLHLEVLCRELPDVARAVNDDILDGARADGPSAKLAHQVEASVGVGRIREWVNARLGPANAARLQQILPADAPPAGKLPARDAVAFYRADAYRIGRERLADETASDALTRTASRTLVVSHAALAGKHSGLTQVTALLKPLRVPLRVLHLAADRLMRDTRSSAAITTTLLVCGVLLVLGASIAREPMPGVAAVGWSLLVGWTATALLRRRLSLLLAAALIAILVVVVHGPEKTVIPLAATLAVILLLGHASWIGAAVLALIVLWWSVGAPPLEEIRAVACVARMGSDCEAVADPARAKVLLQLVIPVGVVLVLALLAKLADGTTHRRRR